MIPGVFDYAEAAFFDGNACRHVADWIDARRLAAKRKAAENAYRRLRPAVRRRLT